MVACKSSSRLSLERQLPWRSKVIVKAKIQDNEGMCVSFSLLKSESMNKPVRFLLKCDELTLKGIKHFYVNEEEWKFEALYDLYETPAITRVSLL